MPDFKSPPPYGRVKREFVNAKEIMFPFVQVFTLVVLPQESRPAPSLRKERAAFAPGELGSVMKFLTMDGAATVL